MVDMQSMQEGVYGHASNYRIGSPHLQHWKLYDRLVALLRTSIGSILSQDLPLSVLEIGAGRGGYTEPALAAGCSVTATEMSRPSVSRLRANYGTNPKFTAVFDPDGSLRVLEDAMFSLIVYSSVLHHIPDYVGNVKVALQRLLPGGGLLTIQDPLWYPRMGRADIALTRLGYYSWRGGRGNYLEGARTGLRRIRGVYDEQNPLDMVEYHVVRDGVDQERLVTALSPHFETVSVIPYWSSQSAPWQRAGEILGRTNTFALRANGFKGGDRLA